MSTRDAAGPGHNPARRQALSCLASWTGAAVVWTVAGGVPHALGATGSGTPAAAAPNALTFVQISDTHIGFRKQANPDVVGSLRHAIADINARRVHYSLQTTCAKSESWRRSIAALCSPYRGRIS